MIQQVPIRKVETFSAEDGRTIEKHTLVQTIETDLNTDETIEFNKTQEIYYGISPIENAPFKFIIEGATSLEDAFVKFIDVFSQIHSQIQKNITEQMNNSIQTATAEDLKAIDNQSNQGRIII